MERYVRGCSFAEYVPTAQTCRLDEVGDEVITTGCDADAVVMERGFQPGELFLSFFFIYNFLRYI